MITSGTNRKKTFFMIQKTFSWEEWKNEVSRLLPRKKYNQLLVWLCENKKKFTPHNVAYWSHKVLLRNPMYWVPCPPDREYISCWVDEMYKIVHSRSRKPSAPGYRSDLWDHGITVFSEVCNRWVAIPIGDRKKHILIKGNVGERVGDHMRRGNILIEGNAGDYCGSRMTAGTIAVMGQTGRYLGYAMRRGTLLLWNQPTLSASFNDCGAHTLAFLPILFASFKSLNSRFADASIAFNRVQRYAGDMSEMGRGEVLVKL